MKVTILSKADYAGSGYKLCEAIKKHTDIDIEIYTGRYYNPYGHQSNDIVIERNLKKVQQRINSSDIIHLKGDWPPENGYLGLKIFQKPIICTVSGSLFRKKKYGGFEMYPISSYSPAAIRTSFIPDLLYPEYSDTWTPHPIDSIGKPVLWKPQNPPMLIHMTTSPQKKDTNFIRTVFKHISYRRKVITMIPDKMSFQKAVQYRTNATIYFDQFLVGFYGNAALEAMQYGIPTACYISEMAKGQARGKLDGCPVLTARKDVDIWVDFICRILDKDLSVLSRKMKDWCDTVHSYQIVAKQWKGIYESI